MHVNFQRTLIPHEEVHDVSTLRQNVLKGTATLWTTYTTHLWLDNTCHATILADGAPMLQLYTRRARGASMGKHALGGAAAARSSRQRRPASAMRLPDSSSTACRT